MINLIKQEGLTFDDVLLVPQFSEITSRSDVDISTKLDTLDLKVPIISANMDTITGPEMARAMHESGGLGFLHRYASYGEQANWLILAKAEGWVPVVSIGIKEEDFTFFKTLQDYDTGTLSICIDVAHGHSKSVITMLERIRTYGFNGTVIAGNVATRGGAHDLFAAGASVVKINIGAGSVCSTRLVTGHGVPQLTAISECSEEGPIIADGGVRTSGDMCKSLAAGAIAVMTGSLFAGCPEAPNNTVYRGMASETAQRSFKGSVGNGVAEGVSMPVRPKPPVSEIMANLAGGIRSGFSYSGARNLSEFQQKAKFIKVTPNTLIENHPHYRDPT